MSLKIAMLLDNPFRPDKRVLREARALIEKGHQVTIYAWDRDKDVERPRDEYNQGIHIIRIPVKTEQQMGVKQIPFYLTYLWRTFNLLRRETFDVIHAHDFLNLPLGILLKIFKRAPLIYDAHEIYWVMEAFKYPKWISWILKHIEISLLHFVDVFITVGVSRADYYRPYYKQKINLVGNWYNPQLPDRPQGMELRRQLGIPDDAFVIGFAGTLSPERAPEVLIECAWRLHIEDASIHWLIAGRGPSEDAFQEAAQKNPNLHYLGWIDNTQPFYSASNALIYLMDLANPYTNYNSPNNLYLAIAWGLPLVGVNAGEIREVFGSLSDELLVSIMDVESVSTAILKLRRQPEAYQKMVIQLNKLQGSYSWDGAAETLYSAYERFVLTTV